MNEAKFKTTHAGLVASSLRAASAARVTTAAMLAITSGFAPISKGATTVSYGGGTYTQNFNSLPSTTASPVVLPNSPMDLSLPLVGGSPAMDGWWYTAQSVPLFAVATSSTTAAAALYSFGDSGSSSDRALGLLSNLASSPPTGNQTFGVALSNTTASTSFTQLAIQFGAALWEKNNSSIPLAFAYSILAAGSPIPIAGTGDSVLTYTPSAHGANAYVNGHATGAFSTLSDTIALASGSSWAPGQTLWLTWSMPSVPSAPGIGIDNLSFTASVGGGPRSLTWNGTMANGTAWNTQTSNNNWLVLAAATNFNSGDNVTFDNGSPGSVVVDSGGISLGSMNISNTTGLYNFTGGAIGGSGALTSSGTATFSNANTFSGGTTITGGALTLAGGNNRLSNAGAITSSGGTLDLGGNTQTTSGAVIIQGGTIQDGTLTSTTLPFDARSGQVTAILAGSVGLNKNTSGSVLLWGSNSYTGLTEVNAGSLTTEPSSNLASANLDAAANATLDVSGSLSGIPNVSCEGAITFIWSLTSGLLTRNISSLNIGSGGQVFVVVPSTDLFIHADRTVLIVPHLIMAGTTNNWTSRLDLGDNDMIIPGGGDAALATLTNLAKQGINSTGSYAFLGAWDNQVGLVSTVAAADTQHLTALGIIENDKENAAGTSSTFPLYGSTGPDGLFDGYTPGSASDVLLKYTYYGDADLNGKIDGTDYSQIDAGFGSGGILTGWQNGDFNYDGLIDGSDYSLIDNTFNQQTAAGYAAQVAFSTSQIAGTASTSVPEPSCAIVLITSVGVGIFSRRSRKRIQACPYLLIIEKEIENALS